MGHFRQHSALAYFSYFAIYGRCPGTISYRFSELLESHAVNTYGQFIDENEALLKKLPPSVAAVQYYAFGSSDPFCAVSDNSLGSRPRGKIFRRYGPSLQTLTQAPPCVSLA
jgi:hypothetical protein